MIKTDLKLNLNELDGNQIIDFLKKKGYSVEFVDQVNDKENYQLKFTMSWNNWGHESDYTNYIYIREGYIEVCLDEPWEGNGEDDEMEELLEGWLKTYTFEKINYKEKFDKLMFEIYDDVMERIDRVSTREQIDSIIEKLKIAKTYL
jgi:hypothetical protein